MHNKETGNEHDVPAEGTPSEENNSAQIQRWERNKELRKNYLQALWERKQALASGDEHAIRAADSKVSDIGSQFVALNRSLVSAAAAFLQGENREDHEAAALMGLWEAFVGTDAETANEVTCDEDGSVQASSGWQPETGAAFSTLSRRHVTGRAARSVALLDGKYQGISYSTFQKIPAIRAAINELTEELKRRPTEAEIAAKAHVTVGTVSAALTHMPASLNTPVGEDGSTLEDLVGQSPAQTPQPEPGIADIGLLEQLPVADLCVAALRLGLTGRPPLPINDVGTVTGTGRGAVTVAINRIKKVLPEI